MIRIKNNKETADIWCGMTIEPSVYYEIEAIEIARWQNNSKVLSDIGSGALLVNNGASDITDVASAINFLKDLDVKTVFSEAYAFAQKTTKDGKKLFRRKHGVGKVIAANSTDTLSISVPYSFAKINKAEIINCSAGDLVNLRVYDTPSGTISGVPNYMLNQFGFNVFLPNGMYTDESNYDADLVLGMRIEIEYTNKTLSSKEIGLNITLHQLV